MGRQEILSLTLKNRKNSDSSWKKSSMGLVCAAAGGMTGSVKRLFVPPESTAGCLAGFSACQYKLHTGEQCRITKTEDK